MLQHSPVLIGHLFRSPLCVLSPPPLFSLPHCTLALSSSLISLPYILFPPVPGSGCCWEGALYSRDSLPFSWLAEFSSFSLSFGESPYSFCRADGRPVRATPPFHSLSSPPLLAYVLVGWFPSKSTNNSPPSPPLRSPLPKSSTPKTITQFSQPLPFLRHHLFNNVVSSIFDR